MSRSKVFIISGLWVLTHPSINSVKKTSIHNYKWNGKGLGIFNFHSLGNDTPTYYYSQRYFSLSSYHSVICLLQSCHLAFWLSCLTWQGLIQAVLGISLSILVTLIWVCPNSILNENYNYQ